MTRGGVSKDRSEGPVRKCIASGQVRPTGDLIRFVVGPEERIVPDILGKLPGRGIWVAAERAALEKAVAKKLFSKAARAKIAVPEDLVATLEGQILGRVTDLISLARKSGTAVAGYEKVKDMLAKEEAQILIQASDGSARGKSKLSTPHFGTYIGWLGAEELGLAFGRQTVIHAALTPGGLTQRVVEEALRLKGLREMDGGQTRVKG